MRKGGEEGRGGRGQREEEMGRREMEDGGMRKVRGREGRVKKREEEREETDRR